MSSFIALSPDELLVGTIPELYNVATGTTIQQQQQQPMLHSNDTFRITIWSIRTNNIQCTLHYRPTITSTDSTSDKTTTSTTGSTITTNDSLLKIVFVSTTLIAAIFTTKIIIWDISRGVVSYVLYPSKYNMENTIFLDATTITVTNATITDARADTGSISNKPTHILNALSITQSSSKNRTVIDDDNDENEGSKKSKKGTNKSNNKKKDDTIKENYIIQEYQITNTTGQLQRMIKAGKYKQQSSKLPTLTSPTTITTKLYVTESEFVLVDNRTSSIRAINRSDGAKLWKTETSTIPQIIPSNAISSLYFATTNMYGIGIVNNNCSGNIEDKMEIDKDNSLFLLDLSDGSIVDTTNVMLTSGPVTSIQLLQQPQYHKSKNDKQSIQLLVLINNQDLYTMDITTTTISDKRKQQPYTISKVTTFTITSSSTGNTNNILITALIPIATSVQQQQQQQSDNTMICILYDKTTMQAQMQPIQIPSSVLASGANDTTIVEWKSSGKRLLTQSQQDDKVVPSTGTGTGSSSEKRKMKDSGTDEVSLDSTTNKKTKRKLSSDMNDDDDGDDSAVEADGDDDVDVYNDDEPTVGERLQILQEALDSMDEESDDDDDNDDDANNTDQTQKNKKSTTSTTTKVLAKNITTESLVNILQQALQSNDDSMLEIVFNVSDKLVIQQTLNDISTVDIGIFIIQLTNRIAYKPNRLEHLVIWIHCILNLSLEQLQYQTNNLRPLQNLLTERTEIFYDLLQLEGTLNMIL